MSFKKRLCIVFAMPVMTLLFASQIANALPVAECTAVRDACLKDLRWYEGKAKCYDVYIYCRSTPGA